MAVTITAVGSGPGSSATRAMYSIAGRGYVAYPFTVAFDSSYPTGGESIAAAVDVDSPWSVLTTVDRIVGCNLLAPGGTGGLTANAVISVAGDTTNKKLILFDGAAEVASTTNASAITIKCIAYGFA